MAVLGLRFCARAFSSCGKRGPLFIAVHRPLTIVASLVVEHRLRMRKLSNCGSWAQLLRGLWDFPRPGLEPVSPALAGRFSTTAPPGKPLKIFFICVSLSVFSMFLLNTFDVKLLNIWSTVIITVLMFLSANSNTVTFLVQFQLISRLPMGHIFLPL